MDKVCDHCGRPGETLRRCTGCWNVRYCSPDCQQRHWPRHKGMCVTRATSVMTSATAGKKEKGEEGKGKNKPKASSAPKTPPAATKKEVDVDGKDGGDGSTLRGAKPSVAPSVCKMCETRLPSTVVKCARCQYVTYCSRDCRRADWLTHVGTCVPVVDPMTEDREKAGSEDEEEADAPETDDPPPPEAAGGGEAGGNDASASRPELTEETGKDEDAKICQKCKAKKTGMKRCGRCLEVTYCSRDCQRADWSAHKVTCQPVEVLTTDGYKETTRREKVARQRVANDLASLLFHHPERLFTDTAHHQQEQQQRQLSWQEARARASRFFPLQRVVDDFSQLDSDFMGHPFRLFPAWMDQGRWGRVVALGRLTTPYFHPFRPARSVEDINGMSVYVIFYMSEPPWPFFRFSQFREGNFICIQGAFLHLFGDGSVGFRIEDASDVRILEPTP